MAAGRYWMILNGWSNSEDSEENRGTSNFYGTVPVRRLKLSFMVRFRSWHHGSIASAARFLDLSICTLPAPGCGPVPYSRDCWATVRSSRRCLLADMERKVPLLVPASCGEWLKIFPIKKPCRRASRTWNLMWTATIGRKMIYSLYSDANDC